MKKIVIGSDHGGYALKGAIINHLEEKGYKVINVGTYSEDRVDYPDFAEKAARMVASNEAKMGILICNTGIGMCISANKIKGIRAANVHDIDTAKLSKEHNNANIITLGSVVLELEEAIEVVESWLDAKFVGGRHKRRIKKISKLENEN